MVEKVRTTTKFFRTDIEGMRAIAILLVIGAHFSVPGFAAGFIGVDIFFVLSGFLITGTLVREYEEKCRINLMRFYANRFRRLFPALATMLIVSSLAAYFILPSGQNLMHSEAAAMAAIWLSNIHFAFADTNYFSAETSSNIFLHTWSLGVEEQFYLLWPLLILLAMILPTTRGRRLPPIWLILLSITFTSFIACLLLANVQPNFAFYMMPTRAWQFSAGGMVWLLSQNMHARDKGALTLTCNVAAVCLLLAAMFFINPASTYPSLMTLLPTLATCALLWAGSSGKSTNQFLLSQPLMQWIGRLSYTWYLWHWPVLILSEHLIPVRGVFINSAGAITLSLVLAILTHHLIENPVRFGKTKNISPYWQVSAALFLMIFINSQMLRWHTQTDLQITNDQSKYRSAISDLPFFYRDDCDDWYKSDELKPCRYGNKAGAKTVVLLGDSIGAQWAPALKKIYPPDEWTMIVLTKSGCPMVDEPFFYQRIGRVYSECERWRRKAIDWIIQLRPNSLFIGSTASYPFTDQQLTLGTKRIMEQLTPSAKSIYLIEANPILGFDGPACLIQNFQKPSNQCTGRTDNSDYQHVAELLESVTSDYRNVFWLQTARFVCPDGQCIAERNGLVVFRDSQHLTATFTASAAEHFKQQIKDEL